MGMKVERDNSDGLQAVAGRLRAGTWDIIEAWAKETKLNLNRNDGRPAADDGGLFDDLPTLIGGVSKVVQDPMCLLDLEPGGSLDLVARQVGRLRHENGYQLDHLINDFSSLRHKLWLHCEKFAPADAKTIFELERRLNLAFDKLLLAAVDSYHQHCGAELMELAQKDRLTGFLHSKAFDQNLDREIAGAKRRQQPIALISAELDNFRQFSIEEGRLEGNRLLQRVATEILAATRVTDYAGRFAGGEFAFILPQTTLKQALLASERMRRQVRRSKHEGHMPTISLGIAALPENAEDKPELVRQARWALTEALKDGGDVIKASTAD